MPLADQRDSPEWAVRIRSEFFSHSMARCTLASLLTQLGDPRTVGRRQITFTAMGGAYNRVAEDATAFAHRSERFLLEHTAEAADPWVDGSCLRRASETYIRRRTPNADGAPAAPHLRHHVVTMGARFAGLFAAKAHGAPTSLDGPSQIKPLGLELLERPMDHPTGNPRCSCAAATDQQRKPMKLLIATAASASNEAEGEGGQRR